MVAELDNTRGIPIEDRRRELIAARHTARVKRLYGASETPIPEPAVLPVWLTADDVIGLVAYGRTKALDGPVPDAPPMFERWRSHVSGVPSDERQYPLVQQLRQVLARVRWWQAHKRKCVGPATCPIPTLDRISRAHVRWIIRQHSRSAVETVALLRADVRKLCAALATHEVVIERAVGIICAEISAEHIDAWGRRGVWRTRRFTCGIHEKIPPQFFANPHSTILGDGWATCGWDVTVQHWADWNGPDWGDVRFKRDEVLALLDRLLGPSCMEFEGGYISPVFITDEAQNVVDLNEPNILVHDKPLPGVEEMLPFLEWVIHSGKPFVFIGEGVGQSLLQSLVLNKRRGAFKVAAVRVLGSVEQRKEILEKIATATGGHVFNDDLGIPFRDLTDRDIGLANRIVIEKGKTRIFLKNRVQMRDENIDNNTHAAQSSIAQGPITPFAGGITWVDLEYDENVREAHAPSSAENSSSVTQTAGANLPLWLTAMQAVAWVCTRNFQAVWRADLEYGYNAVLDNPRSFIEEWFPPGTGITTLTLDAWHGMDGGQSDWLMPSGSALDSITGWLRAAELRSSGVNKRGDRCPIDPADWRLMTLAPGSDSRVLVPHRARPSMGEDRRWQDILIHRDDLFRLCPPRRSTAATNSFRPANPHDYQPLAASQPKPHAPDALSVAATKQPASGKRDVPRTGHPAAGAQTMPLESPWIGAGDAIALITKHHACTPLTASQWLERWYETGEIDGRPEEGTAAEFYRQRGVWTRDDDVRALRGISNAVRAQAKLDDLNTLWEFDRAQVVAKCQRPAQDGTGQSEVGTAADTEVVFARLQQADLPPSGTLPWAVNRTMERLGCPPDHAWNLVHGAMRTHALTPRRGSLFAPDRGTKLAQWERDNLDFDFRRYQDDARSGGPVGSLRIGGQGFHPHEITIPPDEVEHWLDLQSAPARGAYTATEPLPPQGIVAGGVSSKQDVPRTDHGKANVPLTDRLAAWFPEWARQNPGHSESETTKAAEAEFPGERITRQMIRRLLKSPDGNPRPRGKKPGKSHSEHAQRMRS